MAGGKGNIKPEDGKQFSKDYQPKEKWTESDALRLGNDLLDWMKLIEENVFFNDFLYLSCDESKYKGSINANLPSYLTEKFTSFRQLMEKARKIQETKLVKFSTFYKLNATMTKFVLINNHDWIDKNQTTLEGGEKPITISFED